METAMAEKEKERSNNGSNGTALATLVRGGRLAEVEIRLREGTAVDERDPHWSYTPLMFAARDNKRDAVEFLIGRGADIYAKDLTGDTVIAKAAMAGNSEIVKILADRISLDGRKEFINEADKDGFTPLMCAAMSGRMEAVDLLLGAGGLYVSQNSEGNTAAHLAAAWGHLDIVWRLWGLGANLHLKNHHNQDVVEVAKANGFNAERIEHLTRG